MKMMMKIIALDPYNPECSLSRSTDCLRSFSLSAILRYEQSSIFEGNLLWATHSSFRSCWDRDIVSSRKYPLYIMEL